MGRAVCSSRLPTPRLPPRPADGRCACCVPWWYRRSPSRLTAAGSSVPLSTSQVHDLGGPLLGGACSVYFAGGTSRRRHRRRLRVPAGLPVLNASTPPPTCSQAVGRGQGHLCGDVPRPCGPCLPGLWVAVCGWCVGACVGVWEPPAQPRLPPLSTGHLNHPAHPLLQCRSPGPPTPASLPRARRTRRSRRAGAGPARLRADDAGDPAPRAAAGLVPRPPDSNPCIHGHQRHHFFCTVCPPSPSPSLCRCGTCAARSF